MTSPSHQNIKTFLLSPSLPPISTSETITSVISESPESSLPTPLPQVKHMQKKIMGSPAPSTSSLVRHAIMYGRSGNGPPLSSSPSVGALRSSDPFPEDTKPMVLNRHADDHEIDAAAQLYHYYLEPSIRLLAQNRLIDMGALRPGLYEGRVGLLPGLHGDFMAKYEKPSAGQRAPREDLSPYTAEEKVERRKARAREYSTIARKRQEAIEIEFKLDLGYMRSFRVMTEEGPNMVAIVAPDLEASVLYASGAFDRVLDVPPRRLVGRSLWDLIHEADHLAVRNTLISVVLTKSPPHSHVSCRLLAQRPDKHIRSQISLAMGTQGVICVFWNG